jgi:DNA-binding NtrC family response regulator
MNILLIDSNTRTSSELVRVLTDWGMTVNHVVSAQQAVDLVKKQLFELVLMELFLKDSIGFEIIPDLKLFNPGVSIVVMTVNSTPELERKARECGIVFYMEKPVPLDQLKLIIDQFLKKQI